MGFESLSPVTPLENVLCSEGDAVLDIHKIIYELQLSSFISLTLGCSKVEKHAEIGRCGR